MTKEFRMTNDEERSQEPEAGGPGARRQLMYFLLPLLVYVAIAAPMAVVNRERINPDAVAYIRRGIYLARGDFYHSVSGYWSPLISWCIAPLVAGGMDGLHAARV